MSEHEAFMNPKIVTSNIAPPIPTRAFDWVAWIDGEEENGADRSGGEVNQTCHSAIAFTGSAAAHVHALKVRMPKMKIYRCAFCDHWHIMAAKPQPKTEIPLKQWFQDEAVRRGKSRHAIETAYYLGKYPPLNLRRVNKRVVYVRI